MMQRMNGRVLAFLTVIMTCMVPASALELAHFNSAVVPVNNEASDHNNSQSGSAKGIPIWGHLGKPEGEGPFPALILMHGCSGVQVSHFRWASLLNKAGYVTLILDSFRPRHMISICKGGGSSAGSHTDRALDAFGALNYLQKRAFVDNNNVSVIGWSHGAITALTTVTTAGVSEKFNSEFKTAIAFYPWCIRQRRFNVPTLVLIGSADDWTPAELCSGLAEYNRHSDNPFELVVYDGAFHAFDNTDIMTGFFVPGAAGKKHWIEYNEAAHEDSIQRVTQFLLEHTSQ